MRILLLLISCLIAFPTPANSCELIGPLVPKFPGESDADYEARDKLAFRDWLVVRKHLAQQAYFEAASSVYVAEVIDGKETPNGIGWTITARPKVSAKGDLPRNDVTLKWGGYATCELGRNNDGDAYGAKAGTIIIIFEGMPPNLPDKSTFYSLNAVNATVHKIAEALVEYGWTDPDYDD